MPLDLEESIRRECLIPSDFQQSIKHAAERIKRINIQIRIGRELDERLGGSGRYEADSYRNMCAKEVFDASRRTIQRYRWIAEDKGINYDAFLDAIDVEVPEALSIAALQWID